MVVVYAAHPDAAAGQLVRCDPAALDIEDEMRKRVAAEHDDRQQPQGYVTGARHEERHERELRDVEVEVADHPFEGLVRYRHIGEVEWHDRRGQGTLPQRVRRGIVAEQCAQWNAHGDTFSR